MRGERFKEHGGRGGGRYVVRSWAGAYHDHNRGIGCARIIDGRVFAKTSVMWALTEADQGVCTRLCLSILKDIALPARCSP